MPLLRFLLASMLALAMQIAAGQAFVAVPPLTGHVVDTANMLDAGQRQALDNSLREYEARTGSQIAVLTVPSTTPEAIEQYSIRVADAWKLGRKGVDDGVILLVAKDNPKSLRRLRIEAGRGVQGSLTDAQSKRVLQDVIAPYFRKNDFYGGMVAGVSAIEALLEGEHLPAAQRQGQRQSSPDGIGLLPLLFFIFVMVMLSRAGRSRRMLSGSGWGTAAGIILGNSIARSQRGDYGGFGDGGFGGSGGGGFTGGGGGFDGGGASGDW